MNSQPCPHVLRQLTTWSAPCAQATCHMVSTMCSLLRQLAMLSSAMCSDNSPHGLPPSAQANHHVFFHNVLRQLTTWSSTECTGKSPRGLPPCAQATHHMVFPHMLAQATCHLVCPHVLSQLASWSPPCAQPARLVVSPMCSASSPRGLLDSGLASLASMRTPHEYGNIQSFILNLILNKHVFPHDKL